MSSGFIGISANKQNKTKKASPFKFFTVEEQANVLKKILHPSRSSIII